MILQTFRVGMAFFGLKHITSDDSRSLVDEYNNTLLEINSSLNVRSPVDVDLGNLCSEGDKWIFYRTSNQDRIDTGVTVNNHHWKNLEDAEVAVCKLYIESLTPATSAASN